MRKPWHLILLVMTGMFFLMFGPPLISQAREVVEATGIDASSAVIKDDSGNVISHSDLLPEDQHYTIDYKWSIPNGLQVTAGDTMAVQIPDNVQTTRDSTFPMVGAIGGTTIGTFSITKGSHTGTVTFNQTYQLTTLGRTGYIHLNVYGTEPNQPLAPILMDKSAAWVDENDPTHINWTVNVLSNNNELVDPTFNDTLSSNQTYVSGSAALSDQNGNTIPVDAVVNGHQLTFTAEGSFTSNLKLTYQTVTDKPTGAETFNNDVSYTDSKGNTGSATATIERPATEPEEPGTTEPENPGTTEPENPGTTEPEEPGTTEPENPGTSEPENPGTTEPEEPGTTEPENPGTSEPENPGTSEPEKPGTSEPEKPGVTEPEKPGTSEPENPGTTEPENPGTSEPENPGTTEPENPGTSEPEKPGVTEPEKPGTSEPENPGTSEPEKPGTSEPENPGTTEPEKPGTSEPEKPGVTEPEKPGTSEPEKPGVTGPKKPGTSESEKPGTTEATKPNTTTPTQPSSNQVGTQPLLPDTTSSTPASTTNKNGQNSLTGQPNVFAASSAHPANTATSAKTLPQTNEQNKSWIAWIGLLLLLILAGSSYLVVRHRRHS